MWLNSMEILNVEFSLSLNAALFIFNKIYNSYNNYGKTVPSPYYRFYSLTL